MDILDFYENKMKVIDWSDVEEVFIKFFKFDVLKYWFKMS